MFVSAVRFVAQVIKSFVFLFENLFFKTKHPLSYRNLFSVNALFTGRNPSNFIFASWFNTYSVLHCTDGANCRYRVVNFSCHYFTSPRRSLCPFISVGLNMIKYTKQSHETYQQIVYIVIKTEWIEQLTRWIGITYVRTP